MRHAMVTREKRMRLRPAMVTRRGDQGLRAGLLAYWKMEEATSATRLDSAQDFDLTQAEGVTKETGKIGFAAGFDGADQILSSTADALKLPSAAVPDFTVAFWCKTNTATQFTVPVARRQEAGIDEERAWCVIYDEVNNKFFIVVYEDNGTDSQQTDVASPVAKNNWVFVAVRIAAAATIDIRANATDGAQKDISAAPANLDATAIFVVGAYLATATPLAPWEGMIDEMGVWNRRLSDAELTTLYNGGSGITFPFQ